MSNGFLAARMISRKENKHVEPGNPQAFILFLLGFVVVIFTVVKVFNRCIKLLDRLSEDKRRKHNRKVLDSIGL